MRRRGPLALAIDLIPLALALLWLGWLIGG